MKLPGDGHDRENAGFSTRVEKSPIRTPGPEVPGLFPEKHPSEGLFYLLWPLTLPQALTKSKSKLSSRLLYLKYKLRDSSHKLRIQNIKWQTIETNLQSLQNNSRSNRSLTWQRSRMVRETETADRDSRAGASMRKETVGQTLSWQLALKLSHRAQC